MEDATREELISALINVGIQQQQLIEFNGIIQAALDGVKAENEALRAFVSKKVVGLIVADALKEEHVTLIQTAPETENPTEEDASKEDDYKKGFPA